jgi:hypothetical protein
LIRYEQMFDTLTSTLTALERLSAEFEPGTVTGEHAVRVVNELGLIRRLTDGMLGKAAKRVEDTSAHAPSGERDAAQLVARAVGADASEARRVISTAKKVEQLPDTAAAVRAGQLSARRAELVADAASRNPGAERELLAAAGEGMVPLKDACVAARARAEDENERAARQHSARRVRVWTAKDGMVVGHFRLTPEVGARVKAAVDAGTQRIFRSHRSSGNNESHDAYAADAFADLVLGESGTAKGTSATVHIVIDHSALVRGNTVDGETCTIPGVGPVNVAWVRELLGEAFVTAVIKKGRDITTVAHFGRHVRAELRTAMIVGGRECDVVGCHARGYLGRDHCEVDFAKGGPTVWWNMGWLCSVHHRRKTKGWNLGPRDVRSGKRTLLRPEAHDVRMESRAAVSRR